MANIRTFAGILTSVIALTLAPKIAFAQIPSNGDIISLEKTVTDEDVTNVCEWVKQPENKVDYIPDLALLNQPASLYEMQEDVNGERYHLFFVDRNNEDGNDVFAYLMETRFSTGETYFTGFVDGDIVRDIPSRSDPDGNFDYRVGYTGGGHFKGIRENFLRIIGGRMTHQEAVENYNPGPISPNTYYGGIGPDIVSWWTEDMKTFAQESVTDKN